MKKRLKADREQLFGVPPDEMKINPATFSVYKSAKKGQTSFRITKVLLESLLKTGKQLGKIPYLIITIDDEGNKYNIEAKITKSNS